MKTRLLRSALAAVLITSTAVPASAQPLTTYSNGDVFLGFRREGTANTLAINLGSARQFLTTAQGGTNDSTAPFKVRFGVLPGTSTAVTSLAPDLTAVFGANWTNNPTDGTGVRWGVVGISGNTSSGIPNYTQRTLFVTRARTGPDTPTSIPPERLEIGDFNSFSSAFNSFVQGTGGSQFRNQQSTINSSAAYIGAAIGPDNWGTRIDQASGGSFGLGSGREVEQTFGPSSGPTDSVLDLWISPNTGSTAIPVDQNTYLGFFTLNNAGELTFTPAASTTAPTITSFTPAFGQSGTSVTITGTGLSGATSVTFNGVSAAITANTATQITATVPAAATTGKIGVTTATGTANSATDFFVPSSPATTTYANGDIFLGFRRVGTADTLAVNLGSARQFLTTAQGGTNNSITPFKVSFGVVPGTNIPVATLAPDLSSVFGPNWATNTTDGTSVRWGVVGISGNSSSGITGYAARTLFVTRARTATNTPTSIAPDRSGIGDFNSFSSAFNSFVQGVGGGSYKNQQSTLNSSVAFVDRATEANNWGTRIDVASEGSFGLGANHEVEQTFGPSSGPTDSVLDLWISPNTGSTAIPVDQNTYLGFFTLNNAGELTFTPAAATAPPTIASFTPTSGPVGTSVVITGTGFTGASGVSFNGVSASFDVNSATQITATVPATATTGKITVTTPNGTVTSNTDYTVTLPAPTITSVLPTSGPVGSEVIIFGTRFTGASSVTFNGVSASFTVDSATRITATVPATATSGTIVVATPNGSINSPTAYTVTAAVPIISSPTTAAGRTDRIFSYRITATGSPTSFSAAGLPPGLRLGATTGIVSGRPTQAGTFSVALSASSSLGVGPSTTLTLTISPPPPVFVVPPTPQAAKVGRNFAYRIKASNSPTQFGAVGLPAGLSLNSSTGLITGIPARAGNFTVTLSASNASGVGRARVQIRVAPAAPRISAGGLRTALVATPFSYSISASNAPQTFTARGLPPGLSLNSRTGIISGRPTRTGVFTVLLSATNSAGTGRATLNIIVLATPSP